MEMKSVAIIGAGITGLATAYGLNKKGIRVSVYEKNQNIGGVIQSFPEEGFIAEAGPNTMRVIEPKLERILKELNIEDKIVDPDLRIKKRFIVRKGKLVSIPLSPLSLFTTPLISFRAKLRLLQEPFINKRGNEEEESLADFARRRLGNELLDYAINPLIAGVYAGDPEKLSARYAFPNIFRLEQNYGSLIKGGIKSRQTENRDHRRFKKRIISFKDGMNTLAKAVALKLGDVVRSGINISSISRKDKWIITWDNNRESGEDLFDALVITIPAYALATLPLEKSIISNLEPLASFPYSPISIIVLGFKSEQIQHPLDGFGLLVPEKEKMSILGTFFTSSLFPHRAPNGHVTLTTYLGGTRQPELATSNLEQLKSAAMSDLHRLLGVKGEPVYLKHFHWPHAIPQFNLGYAQHLKTIENAENAHPLLYITGNYRTGVAVGNCLLAGLETADKVERVL